MRAVDARALSGARYVRAKLVHAKLIHAARGHPVVDALVDVVLTHGAVELRRAHALEPEHEVMAHPSVDTR